MKLILILIVIASHSWANDANESAFLFKQESLKRLSPSQIKGNPEIYLDDQSLIRDGEGEGGIYTDTYYTKKDSFKMSIGYQTSLSLEDFAKLRVINIQIMKKIASYKDQWLAFQLQNVVGAYSTLADELETSTDPDSDGFIKRGPNDQSMTLIGIGLGYRFKALTQMFDSDRVFENVHAYGNYITNLDSTTSEQYNGYGLTTEYSIERRISEALFVNLKFGYNIASVVRDAKDDEKKQDRSLVFRWTTVGFDFGYYF
jgi:hypothetical protein